MTSASGLNFRINPNNGAPVDGNLNNTAAPPDGINTDGLINNLPLGATGVSGAAYTNSYGQPLTGGVTTQYVLDAETNQLFIQNPPNAGTLTGGVQLSVGGDPLDFTWVSGFDIPSDVRVTASGTPVSSGTAYAALMVDGPTFTVALPSTSCVPQSARLISAIAATMRLIAESPRWGYAECAALPLVLIRTRNAPFEPIARSLSVGSPLIRYSHFAANG